MARLPILLVAASPLFVVAGFALGSRILLPALCGAPAWAAMVLWLARGERGRALAGMLGWAALLGATTTAATVAFPERAGEVIVNGAPYWTEMSAWLETGKGRESEPALFIPQHLLHAGLFAALSLATASLVSIVFGAALMNYMAYYVGQVALLSGAHPFLAALAAWHPWSLVRIASFVVLGVVLAEPLLRRIGLAGTTGAGGARLAVIAAAGLVLDMAMKALLAPHWPALLGALR